MENDTNATPSPAPAEQPQTQAPTPSLEEVAKEFNVEDQASNFTARPQPPAPDPTPYYPNTAGYVPPSAPTPAPYPHVPDPVMDQDGYRAYMAQQAMLAQHVQGTVQALNNRIEQFERQQLQAKVTADISKAVTKVNEKLKVDPQLVEAMLNLQYQSDQHFQKIWDHRDRNPAAFEKALSILADKLAPKFQIRQDPQLTENQRAAIQSTRTMASTAKSDVPAGQEGLYSDNPAEFERAWDAFKRGMTSQ